MLWKLIIIIMFFHDVLVVFCVDLLQESYPYVPSICQQHDNRLVQRVAPGCLARGG